MLAAAMALEFAPKESEGVLEELAAGKGLDATEARFTLQEWRAGKLKSFLSLRISPDVEMSLARRRVL